MGAGFARPTILVKIASVSILWMPRRKAIPASRGAARGRKN